MTTPGRPKREAVRVNDVVDWLAGVGTPEGLNSMARYNVPSDNAYGVSIADLRAKARSIGRDHELALALWDTSAFEARILAGMIADPAKLAEGTMDRWCAEFDSWAICDSLCSVLFNRTPHAWSKVYEWAPREEEFVRRAAYALIWALATHDKTASDDVFIDALKLIETAPNDDRPLVKKAMNMALRNIGKRNHRLNEAARRTCVALMAVQEKSRQWIGRHALRELESEKVQQRLDRKRDCEAGHNTKVTAGNGRTESGGPRETKMRTISSL